MEQLHLSASSTTIFTFVLVTSCSIILVHIRVFLVYRKGLVSVSSPTASLYHFRTRAELDRFLEASQIRERAIERITNVIGT